MAAYFRLSRMDGDVASVDVIAHLHPSSWPGLSRPSTSFMMIRSKTWMLGTSPGMREQGAALMRTAGSYVALVFSDMTIEDKKTNSAGGPANLVVVSFALLRPMFAEPGRHNVRIFSMPPEQIVLALVAVVIVGFPIVFFIGLIPVWDFLGNLPLLKQFHNLVAPTLVGLPDAQLPAYPLKRTLIAIIFMIECFLLGNLFALGFRRVRRRALLVWRCYDRQKLLLYLFLSGIAFVFVWYFFFYDWRLLAWLAPKGRPGVGTIMYLVVSLPVVTLIFGHLVAIVSIGLSRMAYEESRRHRSNRRAPV